jgi:hypothetical protein
MDRWLQDSAGGNKLEAMNTKLKRRSLFAPGLLFGMGAVARAQAPQINASTQIKNLPPAQGGDNWQSYPATGAANGSNTVFTIAPVPALKKVRVYLNGVRMSQSSEVTAPVLPNISVAFQASGSGAGVVITFSSPIPQTGDSVVIEAA